ncbi:hypothetical protein IHE44_0007319, partial [Lamprotornis superbus]
RLSRKKPHWDLPFLAFLVEIFDCLDLSKHGDSILEIMSRHLQSKCRERRRLVLRGLVVLSKDPSMAFGLWALWQQGRVAVKARCWCCSRSLLHSTALSSTQARKMCTLSQSLVELLGDLHGYVVSMTLSVLTNDDIHLQLHYLNLFLKVMDFVVDKGKKPLKRIVSQSLVPLFFHCHDENKRVAK